MKSRNALLAGLALIGLTNAIALAGVWYNRSGEADSRLLLSGRELQRSYDWSQHENSGLALRLDWRLPSDTDSDERYRSRMLDEAKLLSLGFELPDTEGKHRYRGHNREVLVVLEMDGPARKAERERERQRREKARAALAAEPGDKKLQDADRAAREYLEQEERHRSRLFAVDVGLDREALRARYPDRSRYALVPGNLHAWVQDKRLTGQIGQLRIAEINVPHAWRENLGKELARDSHGKRPPRFQMEVSFGRRLEPWISAAPEFPDPVDKVRNSAADSLASRTRP
ncbi:DUF4824 family protein [Pseudomonas sp. BN102]|uniref:DUF4824 family protein n=1 Tax=Pseudomonas sp. BN102 TaxID=2567886 RepID=UPI00245387A7|nr:DUF4824 family protein [Pseudomonas sp. BN102]MDH4607631.1 DUF4824 family protein [Pseudomonas sp. BN102]